jgi:hypothetical protein
VKVHRAARRQNLRGLVRNPHTTVYHRIACEVEAVFHVILAAFVIVVSAHKNPATRPLADHFEISLVLTHTDIPSVNYEVLRLHDLLDVAVNQLCEVRRTVTIRFDVIVVKDACQK